VLWVANAIRAAGILAQPAHVDPQSLFGERKIDPRMEQTRWPAR
jgi:hypothetical protein